MNPRTITESATIVVAGDVLASEFGSEYILLNLKNGTYYGLENVGGEIWRMIQRPVTVGEICRALVDAFDVDADRCRRDVLSLVTDLVANGLVEMSDQAP